MCSLFGRDKNILTAHLDEAIEEDNCPLCYLRDQAERRYLDALLYERINDPGTREDLRRSRGFCTYHTYRLLEVGGYGVHAKVVILYKDLVDRITGEIRELDERRAAQVHVDADCPICRTVAGTEHTFAEVLADRLREPGFQRRYAASTGLCMHHYYPIFALARGPAQGYLRRDQLQRLEALSSELGEFIRKSVIQVEPFGEERDAWIRVIRRCAGTLKT